MLEDTSVRLRVLSPTAGHLISDPATATLGDAAEFPNVSDYDLSGDAYKVTAASLDIDSSRVTYKVEADYSGTFTQVSGARGFNGYELFFSELQGNDDLYIRDARLVSKGNSLDMTQDRIDTTHSKLFINISGLPFEPDDGFKVQLGFRVKGDSSDQTLKGADGRDVVTGGGGDDKLFGEGGDDRLSGGVGADTLKGGGGEDRFVFKSTADSKTGTAGRDTILDFKQDKDRIDLKAIDANEDKAHNQKFHFIEDDSFSHKAGELRAVERTSGTYVQGDTDGDGHADFAIKLHGHFELTAHDFLL